MPPLSFTLEELLPHRAPMILIDRIESVDLENKRLTASVTVKPQWSAAQTAIEFMAQSAAALAGYEARLKHPDQPVRPGFLLGTRKLALNLPRFEAGKKYLIKVASEFGDEVAGSFSCTVEDEEGQVAASAIINAYRPPNIDDFMKGLLQ